MTQLTWDAVLANKALIGGDVESEEDGIVCRGPLEEMHEDCNSIFFKLAWTARQNRETSEWEKWDSNMFSVEGTLVLPADIGNGRVFFAMPGLGTCTLFPKGGGNTLDPHRVKDLPKNWERLLALYPDLRFNRDMVLHVAKHQKFASVLRSLQQHPSVATFSELIPLFRHEGSVEEFLWHYIEAMTGESDVHSRVY